MQVNFFFLNLSVKIRLINHYKTALFKRLTEEVRTTLDLGSSSAKPYTTSLVKWNLLVPHIWVMASVHGVYKGSCLWSCDCVKPVSSQ